MTLCLFRGACFVILLCVKSVEVQLCGNWTKVKQESGLSQADHPLLVGPLLIEIRVSLFRNADEQYSSCNFLQNADFNRISINNGPTNRGWFPCGLMCDWSVSVMSLQWLSKCNLGRLHLLRVLQTQEMNQKNLVCGSKAYFPAQRAEKKKQNKTKNCRLS